MEAVTVDVAGRLAPIAALVEAARSDAPDLAARLEEWFGDDTGPGPTMRVLQHSTISDRYGRLLLEEVLPDAEREVKLRADAYSRDSAGISAGGHCAFKL